MKTRATYDLTEDAVIRVTRDTDKIALAIKEDDLTFKVMMTEDAALRVLRDLMSSVRVSQVDPENTKDLAWELEDLAISLRGLVQL